MRATLFVLLSLSLVSANATAKDLFDDFTEGELNQSHWCPCQIDEKVPVTFSADRDKGDHLAHITVTKAIVGEKECSSCVPPTTAFTTNLSEDMDADEHETLGPSFIQTTRSTFMSAGKAVNPYCKAAKNDEGKCLQRQELRVAKTYAHAAGKPYLYSIRFRMPATVGDEVHSIRWVTAQWKQEPVKNYGLGWSQSPFLAQRYDNGVLHVTVQDEDCRCIVASAAAPGRTPFTWKNGTPGDCKFTYPDELEGKQCKPNLDASYGPDPVLTSPRGIWTEMSYQVQAGRVGTASIEVYQDKRFIVRVSGRIGYDPMSGQESKTKFKIGHYRDFMPFADTMDLDWVRVVAK